MSGEAPLGRGAAASRMTTPGPGTWRDAFLMHQDDLRAYLRRRVVGEQEAADLVQEIFLRIDRLQRFEQIDDHRAYLLRVAANLLIDRERGGRRAALDDRPIEDIELEDQTPDPLQQAIDRETLKQVDDMLAQMPEATRAMLYLLRVDGWSYAAVASAFGVSKSTVEKRVGAALERCRAVRRR